MLKRSGSNTMGKRDSYSGQSEPSPLELDFGWLKL